MLTVCLFFVSFFLFARHSSSSSLAEYFEIRSHDRALRHPNIMELLAWSLEPYMVIVTKFMSGGNLFQLIHSGLIDNAIPFVKILRDIVCV